MRARRSAIIMRTAVSAAALACILARPTSGAWLREYASSSCGGGPILSQAEVALDACIPACNGGVCSGGLRVHCGSDGPLVQKFWTPDCSAGTVWAQANTTLPSTDDLCVPPHLGSNSFRIVCDDANALAEQSALVKRVFYTDSTCSTPKYGAEFSDSPVGICVKTNDSPEQSRASYLASDRSALYSIDFDGAGCEAAKWKGVERTQGGDLCVASFASGQAVYSKVTFPPLAPGQTNVPPPLSWPPADASIGWQCSDAQCSQSCTARFATRLGSCFGFGGTDYSSMRCTPNGANRGLTVHSDAACANPLSLAFINPTGASQCNAQGQFQTCPDSIPSNAKLTVPSGGGIWNAQFKNVGCEQSDYNQVTFYSPSVCFYDDKTASISEDGTEMEWYSWSEKGCTGTKSSFAIRSEPLSSCQPHSGDNYASSIWSSDAQETPSFTLDTSEPPPPTTETPTVSSTAGNSDSGSGTGSDNSNGGGVDNGGNDGSNSGSTSTAPAVPDAGGFDGGATTSSGPAAPIIDDDSSNGGSSGPSMNFPLADDLDGAAPARASVSMALVASVVAAAVMYAQLLL